MPSATQNPVPPRIPLGVADDAVGFGGATCFPMGQAGLRVGIQYPVGSIVVAGAGTAGANGTYLYFEVGEAFAYAKADDPGYLIWDNPLVPGWCIFTESTVLYAAAGSAGQPAPTTSGWAAVSGDAPVPTVEFVM